MTDQELREFIKLLTPQNGFDAKADGPVRGWAYYLEVPGSLALRETKEAAVADLAEHVFASLRARLDEGGTLPTPLASNIEMQTQGAQEPATLLRFARVLVGRPEDFMRGVMASNGKTACPPVALELLPTP